jgi:hypothetical protein
MKYLVQLNKITNTHTLKYIFNCEECPHYSHLRKLSICKKFSEPDSGIYTIEKQYSITFLNGEKREFYKIQHGVD